MGAALLLWVCGAVLALLCADNAQAGVTGSLSDPLPLLGGEGEKDQLGNVGPGAAEKDPSPFVSSSLDLVQHHGSDVTLDSLYGAYVESKQNEQRLVDRVEALSGQVTALTNQLVGFFSASADTGSSNSSMGLRGLGTVTTLQIEATGGVTYTRWGRTHCENSATLLYRGLAAGSRYNEAGGGADLLCLHEDPQWYRIITAIAGTSNVWNAEYRGVSGMFDTANNAYMPLDNHDVLCAVCHVQTRSQQIMIPARRDCPTGWRREYWGYLLSQHSSHTKGAFACVDEAPESVPGGSASTNSHLLYPVEARCPGLKCPPYIDGAEVTCVVCTK